MGCRRSHLEEDGDRRGKNGARRPADSQRGVSKPKSSLRKAVIGLIGASWSSERRVAGMGSSLLEGREDQRSRRAQEASTRLRKLPLPPGLGRKLAVFLSISSLQAGEAHRCALSTHPLVDGAGADHHGTPVGDPCGLLASACPGPSSRNPSSTFCVVGREPRTECRPAARGATDIDRLACGPDAP